MAKSAPNVPQYQLPSWASGLPPEMIQYIRSGIGREVQEPPELGISSQALQNMLQYQPSQFQFPIGDIQASLDQLQALQYQDYLKQMRPTVANQGQLDSTYYSNLINDYLKTQSAQNLGNRANLLTQQALTNLDLSKWLPQFQSGVAGQLAGLGGQKAGIQEYNLQYPYQTYIPALSGMFGQGMELGGRMYESQMAQYQQALQEYQNKQKQQSGFLGSLGTIGGGLLGAALAIPTGGLSLAAIPAMMGGAGLGASLGGAVSPLWGGSGGGIDLGNALGFAQNVGTWGMKPPQLDLSSLFGGGGSSTYNVNWNKPIQGGRGGSLYNIPQFGTTWSPYK